MLIKGVSKKEAKRVEFSDKHNSVKSFGKKEEYLKGPEAVAPISAVEMLEKGVEVVTEKAGEVWDRVRSEWKDDRFSLVKRALVGAAVTGAVVGLVVLSTRKKNTTIFKRFAAAI